MIEALAIERKRAAAASLVVDDLHGLSRVMVVVGRSGAGRTRFLELVEDAVRRAAAARAEARRLLERLDGAPPDEAHRLRIDQLTEAADRVRGGSRSLPAVHHLRPTLEPALDGSRPSTWWRTLSRLDEPDFAAASAARFVAMRHAARVLLDASMDRPAPPEQLALARRTFDLVERLTGQPARVALSRDPTEPPLLALGRRRAREERLTDSQRMALSWAVLLARSGGRLKDAIVLVDGPERELQPEAARALIELLMAQGPAQLWLATASPALVAGVPPEAVLRVVDGHVQPAGAAVGEELDRLCGGPRGLASIARFAERAGQAEQVERLAAWIADPDRPGGGRPARELLDPAPGDGALAKALRRLAPEVHVTGAAFRPWFSGGEPLVTSDSLRSARPPFDLIVLHDVFARMPLVVWPALLARLHELADPDCPVLIATPAKATPGRRAYLPEGPDLLQRLLGLGEPAALLGGALPATLHLLPLGALRLLPPEPLVALLQAELSRAEGALRRALSEPPRPDILWEAPASPGAEAARALRAAQLREALSQVQAALALPAAEG